MYPPFLDFVRKIIIRKEGTKNNSVLKKETREALIDNPDF